jgi:nucleoside-diphosphate-sugar epimerase
VPLSVQRPIESDAVNTGGTVTVLDVARRQGVRRVIFAASSALAGRPITIYGDGEQTRDFCFIDNTVRANLLAAASSKKLTGQIVNVAGGRRIGLNELCRELSRALGRDVAVEHVAPRAGDIRHSLADITAARDLLGYEPLVRWEDGLGRRSLTCGPSERKGRALPRRSRAVG